MGKTELKSLAGQKKRWPEKKGGSREKETGFFLFRNKQLPPSGKASGRGGGEQNTGTVSEQKPQIQGDNNLHEETRYSRLYSAQEALGRGFEGNKKKRTAKHQKALRENLRGENNEKSGKRLKKAGLISLSSTAPRGRGVTSR